MTRPLVAVLAGLTFGYAAVEGCLFWVRTLSGTAPALVAWPVVYGGAALTLCLAVAAGARRTGRVAGRHVHRIEATR